MALDRPGQLDEDGELVDQVRRGLAELGELWNNRFTLQRPRLTERYRKGEIDIVVLFTVGLVQGSAEQYVAVIHGASVSGSEPELRGREGDAAMPLHHRAEVDVDRFVAGEYDHEGAVLVNDVEVVQFPEELVLPSNIRFEFANRLAKPLRGTLYFSRRDGFQLLDAWSPRFAPDGKAVEVLADLPTAV